MGIWMKKQKMKESGDNDAVEYATAVYVFFDNNTRQKHKHAYIFYFQKKQSHRLDPLLDLVPVSALGSSAYVRSSSPRVVLFHIVAMLTSVAVIAIHEQIQVHAFATRSGTTLVASRETVGTQRVDVALIAFHIFGVFFAQST
jgi:hypothetical protein